jgi:hypothetical protein
MSDMPAKPIGAAYSFLRVLPGLRSLHYAAI